MGKRFEFYADLELVVTELSTKEAVLAVCPDMVDREKLGQFRADEIPDSQFIYDPAKTYYQFSPPPVESDLNSIAVRLDLGKARTYPLDLLFIIWEQQSSSFATVRLKYDVKIGTDRVTTDPEPRIPPIHYSLYVDAVGGIPDKLQKLIDQYSFKKLTLE